MIKLESFSVSGKAIVVTNAQNKFGEMWSDFFKTYVGGQPVAVYADFGSDENGKFAFLVGVKTYENTDAITFNSGNYLQFHLSDKSMILKCWKYI